MEAAVTPTPSAVAAELGTEGPSAPSIRAILKERRKAFGKSTRAFSESVGSFKAGLCHVDSRTVQFHEVRVTGNKFAWVAALPAFLDHLKILSGALKVTAVVKPSRVPLVHGARRVNRTEDFTFNVTWQNYSYGVISAVVYKVLNGRWRKSLVSCFRTESGPVCVDLFRYLKEDLMERGLSDPSQVHFNRLFASGHCLLDKRIQGRDARETSNCFAGQDTTSCTSHAASLHISTRPHSVSRRTHQRYPLSCFCFLKSA